MFSSSRLTTFSSTAASISLFCVLLLSPLALANTGPALPASPMAEALRLHNAKQYGQAIELLQRLYLQSPLDSGVINNLAANFIVRGAIAGDGQKNYAAAANDFRHGLYLLRYEWPEELPKTTLAKQNEQVVYANLVETLQILQAPIKDKNWHLAEAKALRAKGLLPEAFTEYAWASQIDVMDAVALEGQGDIYTVRRRYERALDTYRKAVYAAGENRSAGLLVKLATAYQHMNEPANAATVFTDALEKDPGNRDALTSLEALWVTELKVNPNNVAAHINLGTVYQHLKQYDLAERAFQEALKRDPNNKALKLNFASLALDKGDLVRANTIYDDLLAQAPNDESLLRFKATLLNKQGKPQDAIQILDRLMAQSTDKESLADEMLSLAQASKNPALLSQTWQRLADTQRNNAKTQYNAGVYFHQAKNLDLAVNYYRNAIAQDPKMAEAYANLGSALLEQGKKQEAQPMLAKAASLNPALENANALAQSLAQEAQSQEEQAKITQAVNSLNQGQYAEAERLYRELVTAHPNNAELQAQYGLALQGGQKAADALKTFDKALALAPKSGEYHYYKATLMQGQNKPTEAMALYQKALQLNPTLSDAQAALSLLQTHQKAAETAASLNENATMLSTAFKAYESGQYQAAIQQLDAASKRPNMTPEQLANVYYYRGLAYEGLSKNDLALQSYKQALGVKKDLVDAYYAQAVLLESSGQKTLAKQSFQQFLNLAKTKGQSDEFTQYAEGRIKAL